MTTTASQSGTIPGPVATAYDLTLNLPLPQLYCRRYGPMPPVVEVLESDGAWGTVGQRRRFRTADGGSMVEDLVALDPPHSFTNRLSAITGPFRPLVAEIVETWSFAPLGTGTRATWTWVLHPTSKATAVLMPVVAKLWQGYARGVLAQLSDEVVAAG